MNMKKNNEKSFRRRHPIVWNLLVIAAALTVLGVAAHLLLLAATRHGARRTVPDFTGIVLDDAVGLASRHDLQLFVNDSLFVPAYEGGIVLDQLPEGGTEVKPGRTVYVTINSFRQKRVAVPHVAGRSLRQAKNMLEIAGLGIERLIYVPDMAENYVLEELFEGEPVTEDAQIEAEMGSGVTLRVGLGEESRPVYVPMLVGLGLREAQGRLWENGFNVGRVQFDEGINLLNQKEARVCMQQPSVGQPMTPGSEVSIRLTLDTELVGRNRQAAEKAAVEAERFRLENEQLRADSLMQAQLEQALSRSDAAGEADDEAEEGLLQSLPADDDFFQ